MYSKLITIKKKFIVIPVYQGKADIIQHYFAFCKGKVSSTLNNATYS